MRRLIALTLVVTGSGCSVLFNLDGVAVVADGGGGSGGGGGGKGGGGGTGGGLAGPEDGGPPIFQLSPTSHAFGMVMAGGMGTPRTFTLTNLGGTTSAAISTALDGGNADQFTLSMNQCNGTTLAPQASCDVTAGFMPSTGGSKSATLTLSAAAASASATLNGTGQGPAALQVMPLTHYFGSAVTGQMGMTQVFTVTNGGGSPTTAAVGATLSGANTSSFTITGNTCTLPLTAGAMCAVTVQFTPPAPTAGAKAAQLDLAPMSGPGGSVGVPLTGDALAPSALSFDMMPFGPSPIGTPVDKTFTLTNTGGGATGALALTIGGGNAGDFVLLPPTGTDCQPAITTLAGGGSCTVRVRFTPGGRGTRASTLTATANPGGSVPAVLDGTGQQAATLVTTAPDGGLMLFGNVEVSVMTAPQPWTVTNVGDLPSGVPTIGKGGMSPGDFSTSGCTTALAADAGCVVAVSFTPAAAGTRAAQLTVSASPGGMAVLTPSGIGQARLTVTKTGTGTGTVTSNPAGINCGSGAGCTALFSLGNVVLTAATTNGSNSFFTGWSGACTGMGPCTVTADTSKTVTANFAPMTYNLAFVTSNTNVARNLGALTNYDAVCNGLATAAGINNGTNNGYLAWLSTTTTRARSRFTASVRGWVRVDGKPMFDLLSEAVAPTYRVFHALSLDERGVFVGADEVMTATPFDDTLPLAQDNCQNFTVNTNAAGYGFGYPHAGAEVWTFTNYKACDQPTRIYCLGNTKTVALSPPISTGKKIWITNTNHALSSGGPSPDLHCQSERPTGVATAKALISTTTTPASAALISGQTYVRPDGQVVGTYAELIAAGPLQSGIWQTSTGAYHANDAWTGYNGALTVVPAAVNTCSNWTNPSGGFSAHSGSPWQVTNAWWASIDNNDCSNPVQRLICVEQ